MKEKKEGVYMVREGSRDSPLSNSFKVAAEVYHITEVDKKKVWYGKLSHALSSIMSSSTVLNSINELINWGIVKVQYGPTDTGRAGRILFISGESKDAIKSVYETYWKEIR